MQNLDHGKKIWFPNNSFHGYLREGEEREHMLQLHDQAFFHGGRVLQHRTTETETQEAMVDDGHWPQHMIK